MLRSITPEETANLIIYAYNRIKSEGTWQIAAPQKFHGRKLSDKLKKQIRVLQALPGIGPKRAGLLIKKFRSLKAIFNALPGELEETPGIGKHTIKSTNNVIQ